MGCSARGCVMDMTYMNKYLAALEDPANASEPRRIELLDDEPGRAFSRLSALIDPALHADLKDEAARKKVTMGQLIEPLLRLRNEPDEGWIETPASRRSSIISSLLTIAQLWCMFGLGYLLGRV